MSPEDQLARLRFYRSDKIAIAIFQHGTALWLPPDATLPQAIDAMPEYDVPHQGEGSRWGDFTPMSMQDGNTMYLFYPVVDKNKSQALRLFSPSDMEQQPLVLESASEVFANRDARFVLHGLHARADRAKDAANPIVVASFFPNQIQR